MIRNYLHFKKWGWILLCSGLLLCCGLSDVAGQERPGRRNGPSQIDPRKEQMREEAQDRSSQIDGVLTEFLKLAQDNQRPTEDLIDSAQSTLEECKRYASVFDHEQKGGFMLLQAWTSFYQDNRPHAVNWSMRACKTNEASQDAWISQALFSMLSGKRPMLPRLEKKESTRQRRPNSERRRNSDFITTEKKAEPFSQKGTLEFDLMGLRSDFFREQFGRLELVTVNDEKIEFKPQNDILCVLFWQDQVAVSDSNEPAVSPDPTLEQPMLGMGFGMVAEKPRETPLQGQRDYFRILTEACSENPEIKFAQIETFKPRNQETFLSEMPDYSSESIPTVVAASPFSNAERFAGLKAEKPFLAIINKEGKVAYAGPSAGFVPAFILTEMTGIQIDLQIKEQEPQPGHLPQPGQMAPGKANETTPFHPLMMGYPPVRTPDETPEPGHDPNKPVEAPIEDPVVEPNAPAEPEPAPKPAPKADEHQDFPTQSIEDQVRAEKLLQSAQMHIEESRKLRMKNPKQGIEDARKVLDEFPDTEYALQARELLRRVPDRWKQQHNITDEELGY